MFWTENEDSLLKEFFPVEGANVSVRLPGRSPGACSNRAKRLDITMRRSWTAIEDDVIRKYYPIEGGRVYLRLPGRNKDACHKRALNLGIKSQNRSERWSKAEDDILREVYPEKGALEAAKKLNSRSEEACKQRASCLGIAYNQNNLPWTDNELQILKEFYPKEGGRVKDRLCGRSRDACITKAKKLGIKYRGLSYKSFDPKREYLQYIETLIAQDQTGENEFVLTFGFLNNKIIVPVTISEGKIHGLFLTDNGHVSSLSKCGLQTMISSAEANGVSFKDGILSVECELDDYVKKLQDFINCISIIVASAN